MLLISHIVIALLSLLAAGSAFLKPSLARLRASYVLVGLTIATGSALIVASSAHLLQTCVTGLSYLVVVTAATVAARYKLVQG